MTSEITSETISTFNDEFNKNPQYSLSQRICARDNAFLFMQGNGPQQNTHVFNHKVEAEGKPMTDQASSGRCWIFAGMNCARQPFCKAMNIEEFEFSQGYLMYWDKIERMNYLLNAYVETAKRGEDADGRLVNFLMKNPSEDGGQWGMLVNLVEKYGLMPKGCFPDNWSTGHTNRPLNFMINSKMRQYCSEIQKMVKKNTSDEDLQKELKIMNEEIYRITNICLGTPPTTFTWEYYDKDKKYKSIGPITPLEFYQQHVKPLFDFTQKVTLVNDPRTSNPYNQLYSVQYLGNVIGGERTLYINQPIDKLKELACASIKANQPVWFGCDVGKFSNFFSHGGLMCMETYDSEPIFGTKVCTPMTKADRLIYGSSCMDHAMVLTGVAEKDGKYLRWRVENSWGEKGGTKGYYSMQDAWFDEFMYLVVVDKQFVSQDILDLLNTEPKMLPAWDPMGALAS